jgi:3-methyladenine DNA glycosylase/8-oxoguanine DNA glycosylase
MSTFADRHDSAERSELRDRFRPPWPLDPAATLRPLWAGPGDPHVRLAGSTFEQACHTPRGPGTLRLDWRHGEIAAHAWGPGAEWLIGAMPDLLGAADDPAALEPRHEIVARLVRRHPGARLTRTSRVFEALVPAVLGQKVTSHEARRSRRELGRRFGQPAPGPLGLRMPPEPRVLAELPAWDYHRAGVEARRADVLRRAATVADRLEEATGLPPEDGRRRLVSLRGIGPWTAAETLRPALGDPDALSVGDYNLPSLVSWLLAGEPRGDDVRMLELLEPYDGQRARVVMLLELSGIWPPRYGPRLAPRSIRGI